MKINQGAIKYSIVEIFEAVEYLNVVSEKTNRKNPNMNVNLDWDLYLELFFGKIIRKQHITAIIGI